MTEAADTWKKRWADEDTAVTDRLKNVIPLADMFCPLWKPYSLTTTRNFGLWLSNRTYTISISSEQHVRSSRQAVKLNVFETGSGSCPVAAFYSTL